MGCTVTVGVAVMAPDCHLGAATSHFLRNGALVVAGWLARTLGYPSRFHACPCQLGGLVQRQFFCGRREALEIPSEAEMRYAVSGSAEPRLSLLALSPQGLVEGAVKPSHSAPTLSRR